MCLSKRNRRAGFTLVELLVVIGIIALLIGILLPVLGRARERANIVKCAANERQLALAMNIYATQNHGWLPSYLDYTTVPTGSTTVPFQAWDYLLLDTVLKMGGRDTSNIGGPGGFAVFACPSDDFPRNPAPNYSNVAIRSYAVNQSQYGYGLSDSSSGVHNGSFRMPWSGGVATPGNNSSFSPKYIQSSKLAQIPNHVWLLGENWGTTSLYTLAATPNIGNNGAVVGTFEEASLNGSPARFHGNTLFGKKYTLTTKAHGDNSGGNYAYADGHVEFIRFADVVNIRCDTDPVSNGSLLNDHWKWKVGVRY